MRPLCYDVLCLRREMIDKQAYFSVNKPWFYVAPVLSNFLSCVVVLFVLKVQSLTVVQMPVAILTGKFRCHYVLRAGCAISMRLVISVNVRAHCGVCVCQM